MAAESTILSTLQRVSRESGEGSYSSERDDAYAEIADQIGFLIERALTESEGGDGDCNTDRKTGSLADEEVSEFLKLS